jgi:DNA-binding response OmpR family regulator
VRSIDRIALIDDVSDADSVEISLRSAGLDVLRIAGDVDVIEALAAEQPASVVLDLTWALDRRLDLAGKIRHFLAAPRLPIVLLGQAEEQVQKAFALEHGADDLIVRPYNPRELVARVRTLLRIAARGPDTGTLAVGVIELDRERFTARVEGRLVELTWKEFELLRVLIEAQGRVVRREVLMGQVWGYSIGVESRTLDVHVRRLRKKLGDEGQRILTLRGVGYRLDASPELVQKTQMSEGTLR